MKISPARNDRVTKSAAARALGVSRVTLNAYLGREGAPQTQDRLYDIDAVRAYLVANAPQAGPAVEEREMERIRARCRLLQAVAKIQNAVEAVIEDEGLREKVRRAYTHALDSR